MPLKNNLSRGDLYIEFNIIFPDYIEESNSNTKLLSTILNQRIPNKEPKDSRHHLFISDIARDIPDEYASEDDNTYDHHEGVQCAQQ